MSVLALINGAQIANGEIVDADDLKDNFNQLINLLNGTSSNKEAVIRLSDPAVATLTLNQLNASGPVQLWQLNSVDKLKINNLAQLESLLATGTAPFIVASTTKVTNLNADLLDDLSSADYAKLATNVVFRSAPFFIENPNDFTGAGADSEFPRIRIPKGGFVATKIHINYQVGSHAASSSLQYTINKRTSADNWAAPAQIAGSSIEINDTNNTIQRVYSVDFADASFAEGDTLGIQFSAQSGVHNERNISINVEGYSFLTIP
jgi:hypothetical protein